MGVVIIVLIMLSVNDDGKKYNCPYSKNFST